MPCAGRLLKSDVLRRMATSPSTGLTIPDLVGEFGVDILSAKAIVDELQQENLLRRDESGSYHLTEQGQVRARLILRAHILLETFFCDYLKLSVASAHHEARHHEEATTELLAIALEKYLNYPTRCACGLALP
jgi:DtxR family Mn-dependent transcriptional regulator